MNACESLANNIVARYWCEILEQLDVRLDTKKLAGMPKFQPAQ